MDLRCGDCLGENGMSTIASKSVDMILCDLPYGVTKNKWDTIIPFDPLFNEYNRVIKDNGAIIIFAQQPFTTDLINANRKFFRYPMVWIKGRAANFFNAKRMPLRTHEDVLVFYKKLPTYNPQMTEGKPYFRRPSAPHFVSHLGKTMTTGRDNPTGERYPTTILEFKKEQGLHPTQKPVPLCEWLVKTYTNEGDLVLDNCMGCGTTGVACKKLDRRFVGWEMDEKYYKVASERIEKTKK